MYGEQYGEYAYWCWGLKGKDQNNLTIQYSALRSKFLFKIEQHLVEWTSKTLKSAKWLLVTSSRVNKQRGTFSKSFLSARLAHKTRRKYRPNIPHTTENTKGLLSSSAKETLSQSILLGGTKKSLAKDVRWLHRQCRSVGVVSGPALTWNKSHYDKSNQFLFKSNFNLQCGVDKLYCLQFL